MDDDDRTLLARLRQGEPRAFDALYARHHEALFAFLLRVSGRRAVAEELLQETWLRLVKHRARLRDDTHVRGWLFTVARNLYRSHLRWAWLDGEKVADWAARHQPRKPVQPDEQVGAQATHDRLSAAMRALPVSEREALTLVSSGGLTPAEAAEVLGISAEAARTRISRGRAALRRALHEPNEASTPIAASADERVRDGTG